jgi:hypothetical protein
MDKAELRERETQILDDLSLPALRAHYRRQPVVTSSSGHLYIYTGPYDFWPSSEDTLIMAIANALNRRLAILIRRIELAADGIWPNVVAYSEPGNVHLSVFVEFNKRGDRVLSGSGIALSSALHVLFRFMRSIYFLLALVIFPIAIYSRFTDQGWVRASIGLGMLLVIAFFFNRLFKKSA